MNESPVNRVTFESDFGVALVEVCGAPAGGGKELILNMAWSGFDVLGFEGAEAVGDKEKI